MNKLIKADQILTIAAIGVLFGGMFVEWNLFLWFMLAFLILLLLAGYFYYADKKS